ncbi:preprotein translocase subunit SecG [Magnetococcales bacterium HHB-1]
MSLIIKVIHIIVALALIFAVLLQKGRGTDMGAAFGGSSQSLFGARGAADFMEKLTAVLATIFMLTSLSLAFFTTQNTPSSSVMEKHVEQPKEEKSDSDLPIPAKSSESQTTPLVPVSPTTGAPLAPPKQHHIPETKKPEAQAQEKPDHTPPETKETPETKKAAPTGTATPLTPQTNKPQTTPTTTPQSDKNTSVTAPTTQKAPEKIETTPLQTEIPAAKTLPAVDKKEAEQQTPKAAVSATTPKVITPTTPKAATSAVTPAPEVSAVTPAPPMVDTKPVTAVTPAPPMVDTPAVSIDHTVTAPKQPTTPQTVISTEPAEQKNTP